jgi:hypothetical protein
MDEIRKQKIKQSMIDILTKNVKYPDCSIQDILGQLKNMWLALEEANLTDGLNYAEFCQHAQGQAMFASIKNSFGI